MPRQQIGSELLKEQHRIESPSDPRRSQRKERRVLLSLPLLVSGFSTNGRVFHERALTQDISRSGCRIHLRTRPQMNSPLALRVIPRGDANPSDQSHSLFEVGWVQPDGDGWTVGASTMDDTDLWTLAFQSHTP